jgi:hypothetical protein
MKSVLRVVGALFALLLVVVGGLLLGARFADGPIAIIAGGPFTSGELVGGPARGRPGSSITRARPTSPAAT